MYFRDIIGQDGLKDHIRRMIRQEHLPHALLLHGKEGVGKLPLALATARYLCCTHRGEKDACGQCPSCRLMDSLQHPDLHFVFPICKGDSRKKWVCDDYLGPWRNRLLEDPYFGYNDWIAQIGQGNAQGMIYEAESAEILRKLGLKAYQSDYKVMIVWLPEKMNAECANKLLKLIEEPPERTVFLLVSDRPDQVLGTIYSRSQPVSVPGIDADSLQQAAAKRFPEISAENRSAYIRLSEGSWTRFRRLLDSREDDRQLLEAFIRCMRGAYTIAHFSPQKKLEKQQALVDLKDWADEMSKLGRERQKQYFAYAQRMVRENYILNAGHPDLVYLDPSQAAFSSKFFPFINHRNVESFMNELDLADRHIAQNVGARMVFFDLALKSILLFK